ncbi:MAG: HepT-like ribonuclease domain-containing protein [Pseudomonadota bacterium]
MRDVLIHDYMGVDLMTVWKVSQERLLELKLLLEGLKPTKKRLNSIAL